jgi:hypothetical protein
VSPGINVDDIAPMTDGLTELARRRSGEILQEFGRLVSVWGTGGLYGKDGSMIEKAPTLPELAASCYAQGVRDAIAVAAMERAGRAEGVKP